MMRGRNLVFLIGLVVCAAVQAQAAGPRIKWDDKTLILVQANATYARMIRLQDGRILCCYDKGGNIWVKASDTEGKTWGKPVLVAKNPYGDATNPELLQLQSGEIFCFYNERPKHGRKLYTIMLAVNKGDGWSEPQRLYAAGWESKNGCWEPAAIQLPTGEVQLFFANESPYTKSAEQEITLLRYWPKTGVWGKPERIAFRQRCRDGMPVPLILADNKGIVVAIEDNGYNWNYQPAIVYSSLAANWRSPHVNATSARRWPALATPLHEEVNAAAPYIRQMPSGETVLSYQCTDRGLSKPRMVVTIGDSWARSFGEPSTPFRVAPGTACLWNSLFVKDAETITAIADTTIGGVRGIWAIDGHFISGDAPDETEAKVIAIWRHRVGKRPPEILRFYDNGRINDSNGSATWSIEGRSLELRWQDFRFASGEKVIHCKLAADRQSYSAGSGIGAIVGELSQVRRIDKKDTAPLDKPEEAETP
jgi:hypothetical protein